MEFIWYPKCSTCRKAKKHLDSLGIAYRERLIKEDNPSEAELRLWKEKSGLPLKNLFNTSGTLYRELGLKDRLQTMSEDEQFALLAKDGMLVKRPVLVSGDTVIFGYDSEIYDTLKNGE